MVLETFHQEPPAVFISNLPQMTFLAQESTQDCQSEPSADRDTQQKEQTRLKSKHCLPLSGLPGPRQETPTLRHTSHTRVGTSSENCYLQENVTGH